MESIKFINKIWISEKKGFLHRFLKVMICIYCILQLFIFLMEGIKGGAIIMFVFNIGIFIWCVMEGKHQGRYIESLCVLKFHIHELEWEYPELKTEKTKLHVLYQIKAESIKDIAVSHELKSLRLNSRPVMTVENGKRKITDFSRNKKDCVLVLYYEGIDYIAGLFEKYLDIQSYVVD